MLPYSKNLSCNQIVCTEVNIYWYLQRFEFIDIVKTSNFIFAIHIISEDIVWIKQYIVFIQGKNACDGKYLSENWV
jgi:hypothetical protein